MQKPIACTAFNRVYSINITDSSPFPFPIINISHDANKPITQELNIFSLTPSEFALKLVFIYFFSANWFPNLHHCDECNFFLRFFADFFFSTVVSTSFLFFHLWKNVIHFVVFEFFRIWLAETRQKNYDLPYVYGPLHPFMMILRCRRVSRYY